MYKLYYINKGDAIKNKNVKLKCFALEKNVQDFIKSKEIFMYIVKARDELISYKNNTSFDLFYMDLKGADNRYFGIKQEA